MYNHNDILIVGDSFCAVRHHPFDWCQLVTNSLTNSDYQKNKIPRGYGFQGASFWSTRKRLLKELENNTPRILIICHTEPTRLPNNNDLGLNYSSAKNLEFRDPYYNPVTVDKKIVNAVVDYYENLISFDFHEWTVKQWQQELDNVLEKYPTIEKIIHFYSFPGDYNKHTFKRGITVEPALFTYHESNEEANVIDETYNHYSIAGNRLFADSVLKLLNNYVDGKRIHQKMIQY